MNNDKDESVCHEELKNIGQGTRGNLRLPHQLSFWGTILLPAPYSEWERG